MQHFSAAASILPSFDRNIEISEEMLKPLRNLNILVAEDVSDSRILMGHYLSRLNGNVHFAEDGFECVYKALHGRYDLILMDLQMPVMDGYEATRVLRSQGYQGTIVAVTAHARKEDKRRCKEIGFDDYLSKPISRGQLLLALTQQHAFRPKDQWTKDWHPTHSEF